MAQKGQYTKSDYLPFEELRKLFQALHNDRLYVWETYCKIAFCTGLRITDIRTTTWKDILNKNEFIKREQKTQKMRLIKSNGVVKRELTNIIDPFRGY